MWERRRECLRDELGGSLSADVSGNLKRWRSRSLHFAPTQTLCLSAEKILIRSRQSPDATDLVARVGSCLTRVDEFPARPPRARASAQMLRGAAAALAAVRPGVWRRGPRVWRAGEARNCP